MKPDTTPMLDIPCPGCGTLAHKSVAWIQANIEYVCTGCNRRIIPDIAHLLATLQETEDLATGLAQTLDQINKKNKG